MNKLIYGDNLENLQKYVLDDSVDLVYLDPPFNSNRNYAPCGPSARTGC